MDYLLDISIIAVGNTTLYRLTSPSEFITMLFGLGELLIKPEISASITYGEFALVLYSNQVTCDGKAIIRVGEYSDKQFKLLLDRLMELRAFDREITYTGYNIQVRGLRSLGHVGVHYYIERGNIYLVFNYKFEDRSYLGTHNYVTFKRLIRSKSTDELHFTIMAFVKNIRAITHYYLVQHNDGTYTVENHPQFAVYNTGTYGTMADALVRCQNHMHYDDQSR